MKQDEKWECKYEEVVAFIEANHRNPSRHDDQERYRYYNWLKHNKKLMNNSETAVTTLVVVAAVVFVPFWRGITCHRGGGGRPMAEG